MAIPAGLISQAAGNRLKELLKAGPVSVALNWTDSLPRSSTVEWELWTNSNDECGATCDQQRKFIKVRATWVVPAEPGAAVACWRHRCSKHNSRPG